MKIGIVGYESQESWTPEMHRAFQEILAPGEKNPDKQNIVKFSINAIANLISPLEKNLCGIQKKPISLRWACSERLDLDVYIISQSFLHFYNDLQFMNKIVIYMHTELNSDFHLHSRFFIEPWSRPMDILLYKLPENPFWMQMKSPWEFSKIQQKAYLPPCANPTRYNPDRKKDIHICLIGAPDDTFDMKKRDYYWNWMQWHVDEVKTYFETNNIGEYFPTPVKTKVYVDIMERSEFMVIPFNAGVYIGRRMFECLASKCIPILWCENDNAKKAFEGLGFTEDVCYYYNRPKDLKTMKFEYDPKMAQKGHDLLTSRHTHNHRCLTILNEIKKWRKLKLDYSL